jgi:hypothetical protein
MKSHSRFSFDVNFSGSQEHTAVGKLNKEEVNSESSMTEEKMFREGKPKRESAMWSN